MASKTLPHPLQRLSSPSRGISAAIHTLGLLFFALDYKYLIDFPTFINESYGWHFQYLTILGLTLSTLTLFLGLLSDLSLSPFLHSLKSTLSLCSAPLEVLISVLYWSISLIDKSLVIPPEIEISTYADIGFHFLPAFFLTLDLLLLSPPWRISIGGASGLSLALALGYWAWVEKCFERNGFYPYPLFAKLDTSQRAVVFTGAAALMTLSTVVLKWLYEKFNGLETAEMRNPSLGKNKKRS